MNKATVGGGGPVNQWVTSGQRGNNTTTTNMDFKTLEEGKSLKNTSTAIPSHIIIFLSPWSGILTSVIANW